MLKLNSKITEIPFVGEKQGVKLNKLGIYTVFDLINHFPSYYKNSSEIVELAELNNTEKKTVKVIIKEIKNIRTKTGKFIQRAIVYDKSGECPVMWFNQPYLTKSLKVNLEVLLLAKLDSKSIKPLIISPEYEIVKESNIHIGKIVPVYPITKGISLKWIRNRFQYIINKIGVQNEVFDDLKEEIKLNENLINLDSAYEKVHLPAKLEDIISSRKRLAFDEILNIYLKLKKQREKRISGKSVVIKPNDKLLESYINNLPYKLSDSQIKALGEIRKDINGKTPMYRLLQGDVGSGKTIVALLSSIDILDSGYQVIIMCPTSVLAEQHYKTIYSTFKDKYKTLLLTSKTISSKINNPNIIISTQAILYHKDKYINNLGLLIIDEQHKFGVEQQKELIELKNNEYTPNTLFLTATPIPRSIALTLFGDISVSIIEKPEGRIPPKTMIVPFVKRKDSYKWIEDIIKKEGQVFWICPLIEEGIDEIYNIRNVNDLYEELINIFPKNRIGLVHGKVKEKEKILNDFYFKKYDILISTTVVEVGIDIPNANVIVIENAERYGLAQLHQLRGRVGRNNQKSWCLLYTSMENNNEIMNRLKFFSGENNGIKIAEFDLKNRGPGEVYGNIQSGIPKLKIANFGNISFLNKIRDIAQKYY